MSNFIRVYKSMFEGLLHCQDIMVYCHMFRIRQFTAANNQVLASNISFIADSLACDLKGKRRDRAKETHKSIIRLIAGGYINSDCTEKSKNSDLISIRFDNLNQKFIKVSYEYFDFFKDYEELYLYCLIASGEQFGKKLSYNAIAEHLGVSKEKARTLIQRMCSHQGFPRIYKFSGSYSEGNVKQEENKYYVKLSEKQLKLWENFYDESGVSKNRRYVKKSNFDMIYGTEFGDVTVLELKKFIRESNWRNGGIDDITQSDFELLMICERERVDKRFVDGCKAKIEAFRSRVEYDGRFEEFYKNYKKEMLEIGIEYDVGDDL